MLINSTYFKVVPQFIIGDVVLLLIVIVDSGVSEELDLLLAQEFKLGTSGE